MMNLEIREWVADAALRNYESDLWNEGTYGMEADFILVDYIKDAIDSYELDGDDPEDIEDWTYDEIFDEAERLYEQYKEHEKFCREENRRWN